MLTSFDKTIAAILAGLVVLGAGHFGFHFSADIQTAISTLVLAGVVYLVPNK